MNYSVTDQDSSDGNSVTSSSVNRLDLKQIRATLWRRRLLIAGVSGTIIVASGVMAWIAKPTYQSSMQLFVSSSLYQQSHSGQEKTEPDFTDSNLQVDYTAQLQLMTSAKLLQRAVDELKTEYPDLTIDSIRGKPGQTSPLVVQQIQSGTGSNKQPSQVFTISFTGKDAVKVQRVLQTLKQVYLDYNIEEQKQRLAKGLTFINEQLPKVQQQVVQSEAALEQFRRQHSLLDPDIQSKNLLDTLAGVGQERRKLQADLRQLQAEIGSNQKNLAQSPQQALLASRLSQSSRYQSLLNEVQKTELTLEDKQSVFRKDTPQVQQLAERRQRQIELLQQEAGRVLGKEAIAIAQVENFPLQNGQLSAIDLKLVEHLVEAQTNMTGVVARDQWLAQQEQQLRETLEQYPQLISQYNHLKPEAEMNRKTLEQLLQAQQSLGLKIAQGGFDWQIVEDPQLDRSTGSGKLTQLLLGVVVGITLAIIAALIAETLDETIYSTQTLQKQANLPLLGSIPQFVPRLGNDSPKSLLTQLSQPSFRSTLDRLYRNLQNSQHLASSQSLVVTSGLPGEGKSSLTLGLAMSAARFNCRVLVIDADLQIPRLHLMLNIPNEQGLFDLLADNSLTLPEKVVQTWLPKVDILTAGEATSDSARLLGSRQMELLLRQVGKNYDLILIDTPPSLGAVDASFVAAFCQGIILITRLGQTTRSELTQTLETLSKLNVLGIVANDNPEEIQRSASYRRQSMMAH